MNKPGARDLARKNRILSDEVYRAILMRHSPIFREVVQKHLDEAYNDNRESVVVVGKWMLTLAIELSQYRYDVIYIVDNLFDYEEDKRDAEKYAGRFKDFFIADYTRDIPQAAIYLGVDTLTQVPDAKRYINLLRRRAQRLLFSVETVRNWREELGDVAGIRFSPYPDNKRLLIDIT